MFIDRNCIADNPAHGTKLCRRDTDKQSSRITKKLSFPSFEYGDPGARAEYLKASEEAAKSSEEPIVSRCSGA